MASPRENWTSLLLIITVHSGSEGTDSLRKKSRQNLADLYCKINRKSPFKKAAKGCFENCMKSSSK